MTPRLLVVSGVVALAAAGLGVWLVLQRHHDASFAARVRDAERTVEILRSTVAAEARFRAVSVSMTTGPGVYLTGTVGSSDDWEGLRRLVEQTPTPARAHLAVGLDTNSPNQHLQATPR